MRERLAEFANIIGVEHPPLKIDDAGNVQLTDDLHDYLVEEGASFDWIFRGDRRAMIEALRDRFRLSPVMEIFREHQAYQNWMNDLPLTWTDEDMEPHYQHLLKLERKMMALPSRNAADFAAKSIVQNFDILTPQERETGAMWQEARSC